MPPRRGIVKTGNAGNSSKPSKPGVTPPPTTVANEAEKPLFPPGSKYPLNLLHERCQKNGWDKPVVDTRKRADGWSFVVTLSRTVQKKGSGQEKETVRLEPYPPYVRPTALEARHWGATYGLYRFCNGIQLNRVLPAGPRDYWNELAVEHKKVENHQQWMYEADPFAARKAVEERQAKAAKKREETQEAAASGSGASASRVSNQFADAPEVKMATELRTLVEDSIKKAMAIFPEAGDATPLILTEDQSPSLLKQLEQLGFKTAQARNAVSFLSHDSALTSNLLQSASPLEACIEYLVLHVPECDLPQRFLPENNSSKAFISSTHSGSDDLKRRWIEERAVKTAGLPAHVVRECTAEPRLVDDWALLVAALNKRLLGDDWNDVLDQAPFVTSAEDKITDEDLEAIGATHTDDSTVVIPLWAAPMQLNLVIPPHFSYNKFDRPPPMYITSSSVPAYVRLHLLSHVLNAFKEGVIAAGDGICLSVMQVIEEQWGIVEDQGPPDILSVMQHLLPQQLDTQPIEDERNADAPTTSQRRKNPRDAGRRRRDPRTDIQIKADFEAVCRSQKYDQLFAVRKRLPAFSARNDFLSMLDKSRVVVVVGETGSGKTTQLPQFILDSLIASGRGSKANILVTQPRRISAISVAARVSAERLNDGSVGYTIRGESKQSEKTKLLFCTTGVVLRRLSTGDDLSDVSHVVVDEVHERSVDGDFLLLELKEILDRHPTLKVILMSATIKHETFVNYFNGAPLLEISGFAHPVTDKYLEDILPQLDYRPQITRPGKKQDDDRAAREKYMSQGINEQIALALQSIARADRLDYQLVAATAKHVISTAEEKGGILIFLQGVQEIRQCIDALRSALPGSAATIFPLHANLSSDEQRAVFAPTARWKIVVATNVAETSITIDDITFVIDAGKVKETQYDPDTGVTKLVETWVTRAAARQRRGRAGRTRPGVCYKLYTRAQEQNMARFPKPEILRVPLENIALSVKTARENEDVKAFLSRAIDPPDVKAIDKAWSVLEEVGAIDQRGGLTALGRYMAMIPLDLRLGKLLILGTIFQCLDPMLTIAACLSSKPVFLSPMDKRDEAQKARARFATEKSDILTDMHAYNECIRLRNEGKGTAALRTFSEQNFISASTIRDITSLRHDLLTALQTTGLLPILPSTHPSLNTHAANTPLLKSLMLSALYPRVSRIALPRGARKFDQVAAGTVQRANTAREWRASDMRGARVWVHPGSVLFGEGAWRSGVVVSWARVATNDKVFLRDVTEVPLYALLLFGGPISINHVGGGVTVGGREGFLKLKAWPRIGILVQQLRRLLDTQLLRSIEDPEGAGAGLDLGRDNPIVRAMLALLEGDGLTS